MMLIDIIGIFCVSLVPLLNLYVYFMVFEKVSSTSGKFLIGLATIIQIILFSLAIFGFLSKQDLKPLGNFFLGSAVGIALTILVLVLPTFGACWMAWRMASRVGQDNVKMKIIAVTLSLFTIFEVVFMFFMSFMFLIFRVSQTVD